MTTAKATPAPAPESPGAADELATSQPPLRRAATPRAAAAGKVTVQYPVSREELNNEAQATVQDQTANSNSQNATHDLSGAFGYPLPQNLPQNRLADFFTQLEDAQEYEGQQFHCFLVRKPDFANDKFRRRALAAENFQPFPITAQSVLDFIPTVQEINGNSGGRFEIRVSDEHGADTGIGASGLTIADPIVTEKPATGGASDLSMILEIMQREREESNKKFEAILIEISKPKQESDLERALKQKVINDILNPPERAGKFDPGDMIATIFTTQQMVSTIADQFAKTLGKNDAPELSTLDKILGNDMLMGRAQDVLNNLATTVQMAVNSRQQPNGAAPSQPQPEYSGYPPLSSPQEAAPVMTPEQQAELERENMEVVNRIITELESDTPLTLENDLLKELREKYPPIYSQLVSACQFIPFETILHNLEEQAPAAFEPFYTEKETGETEPDGTPIIDLEFNERGKKIEARLKELYELLKTVKV